ncbi:MAG: diheme cytochrome c [Thiobacillus sp.]|nr:diheme cytochrome c [Thiobacillus sp.]
MGVTRKNLALLLVTLAASGIWLGTSWGQGSPDPTFAPVSHTATATECAACHMAYPAGLLPARSWTRMMRELENHFGEDASLSPEETLTITRYLTDNAADSPRANERSRRIAAGIGPGEAPLRFTETAYFRYLHDEVPSGVWKRAKIASRANCIACHTRADAGSFAEREIRIPKE